MPENPNREEVMKSGLTLSAMAAALIIGGAFVTPAAAQTKAECRQHLAGSQRTSNPQAQKAAQQAYQNCLKKAKK
jgi:hypothetical protein